MFETGLSDFHKIGSYRKFELKIINYKKYKDGSNDRSKEALINELSTITINKDEEWSLSEFVEFVRIFKQILFQETKI